MVPKHVAARIEKLQCDFLWGGLGGGFKHHLGSGCGGLGGKRISLEKGYSCQIWGGLGRLDSKKANGAHGCSLWKGILSGWDFFKQHVELVAGLGNRIRFWHDNWCGEVPLKAMFPVLFACSSARDASIAASLSNSGVNGGRIWDITFIRDFKDWEVDQLRQHGVFDAKSFYHALDGRQVVPFPWKAIWRVKAPRRVSFFVWSAAWGKILTCDNLMRRGYSMAGWCCMC
uniref:Reverse transcriptase zinc-binding domain-containing protein n=1 Tax=Fagus sylvatica TaxID=28930 RepID=A0A2N9F7K2_FAGSY